MVIHSTTSGVRDAKPNIQIQYTPCPPPSRICITLPVLYITPP